MLKNYLKVAFRNILRQKGFTLLNITGLSIGIAASLLILQYVDHELSYDQFHENSSNIYRVEYDSYSDGALQFKCATAFPRVGPTMVEEFPEVVNYSRLFLRYGGGVVRYGEVSIKEDYLFQADQNFLDLFSYELVSGDITTALKEPNTAVVSVEAAKKYFGDEDPIGKNIKFGNQEEYEITGVIKSPEHSHLKFNFLLSYVTLINQWGQGFDDAWGWYDFYTYLELQPGASVNNLEAKFPAYIEKQGGENASNRMKFVLQPLEDIHLYSDLIQEARVNGNGRSVYFLMLIAFFILVIAWVNYINLSTARALERAKEVGIRKAIGAVKKQLIRQFIIESVLLNIIAAILGLLLLFIALPLFNQLANKGLELDIINNLNFWLSLGGLLVAGAFLSGLYPAFVLSSYKPAVVLKGATSSGRSRFDLRKVLVMIQFVASVGLIAGTLIVRQQLSYMQNQDLGIDIDQMVVINGPGVIANDSLYADDLGTFKNELAKHPGIEVAAVSTEIPGNLIYWTNGSRKLGSTQQSVIMYKVGIDYDFIDAYQHRLVAGRGYSREFTADQSSVILNEKAVKLLGFDSPEEAIGDRAVIGGDTLEVVGVIANYHQEGLMKDFDQTAFLLRPTASSYYSVKLSTDNLGQTLAFIGEKYRQFFPGNPYDYFFLDSFFDEQYNSEKQFGQVFSFFSLLAIFVACLGLFGLASFSASRRTKEIGIRKALGSSVPAIFVLVSKEYVKLILIANLIAVPIVWLLMNQWLQTFAFRIGIEIWIFLLAAVVTLIIALITVSFQSIKAALISPAHSLRYE